MHLKTNLESKIVRWTRILSLIGLVGLLLLAFITVFEALSRKFLGLAILGVADLSSLVVSIAVCACMPLVFAKRGNITVRFIVDAAGFRGKAILECFGTLVSMFIFCLLAWQLLKYTNELFASKATTWIILWPTAPWWYVATFLVSLCIPVQVILFFLDLRLLLIKKEKSDTEIEKYNKAG